MKIRSFCFWAWMISLPSLPAAATEWAAVVPMLDKGAATYYVDVKVKGAEQRDFLVDTGAGYMTINEQMLGELESQGEATYVKDLQGILANGSRLRVPVYRLSHINIGGDCVIRNVDAAVFPGTTRPLLGLSALRKAAPFMFSMEPPSLQLSQCGQFQNFEAESEDKAAIDRSVASVGNPTP